MSAWVIRSALGAAGRTGSGSVTSGACSWNLTLARTVGLSDHGVAITSLSASGSQRVSSGFLVTDLAVWMPSGAPTT